MDEFELIRRFFSTGNARGDDVALGIGDDAAILRVPEGQELAVSVDSLVAGVHFPVGLAADS
ncbi:MAG: AIR synthase related protein, partial [Gammaproteobacteria bacterium]